MPEFDLGDALIEIYWGYKSSTTIIFASKVHFNKKCFNRQVDSVAAIIAAFIHVEYVDDISHIMI